MLSSYRIQWANIIEYPNPITLSWIAENVTSLIASGDWSGSKEMGTYPYKSESLPSPEALIHLFLAAPVPAVPLPNKLSFKSLKPLVVLLAPIRLPLFCPKLPFCLGLVVMPILVQLIKELVQLIRFPVPSKSGHRQRRLILWPVIVRMEKGLGNQP